jgi:hypothetical protein
MRWTAVGACALYLGLPAASLTVVRPQAEGLTWQDTLALISLWCPIEFD